MDKLQEQRIRRGEAYNIALRYINENKDNEEVGERVEYLRCLVEQFYLGLEAQRELHEACVMYGLMGNN